MRTLPRGHLPRHKLQLPEQVFCDILAAPLVVLDSNVCVVFFAVYVKINSRFFYYAIAVAKCCFKIGDKVSVFSRNFYFCAIFGLDAVGSWGLNIGNFKWAFRYPFRFSVRVLTQSLFVPLYRLVVLSQTSTKGTVTHQPAFEHGEHPPV